MPIHRIIDISVPLGPGYPVWPGDPPVVLERFLDRANGDPATASRLSCSVHSGTHVDAPGHMVDGGASVEGLDLRVLIGEATVVDLRGRARITEADLEAAVPAGTSRLLIRTDNSRLWHEDGHRFREDFVALEGDAARWIVARGIRLVGIDYHSVQPFHHETMEVHEVLLGAAVVLLEAIDLSGVEAGLYRLVCLPLRVAAADGAPARAVLIQENQERDGA